MINELIVLTSFHCNYSCDFCISHDPGRQSVIDKDKLIEWIKNNQKYFNFESVSFQGGEPLLMPVEFYLDILNILDKKFKIRIQTNGEPFVNNPEYWMPLFNTKRVLMDTSFQLGEHRKDKNGQVLTPELFEKYQETFKKYLGEYLSFKYVITDDNYSYEQLDKFANIVKRYGKLRKPAGLLIETKSGKGKYTYIPVYKAIRSYIYLLKKHKNVLLDILPLKSFIMDTTKHEDNIACENCRTLTIHPEGDISYCCRYDRKYFLGTLSDNYESLFPKIDSTIASLVSNKYIINHDECEGCSAQQYCADCFIRLSDIRGETKEQQKKFCQQMWDLVFHIDDIKRKVGI